MSLNHTYLNDKNTIDIMNTKNSSQNFPSIEFILRSIEKDEEYCNHISRSLVKILDSLSNFVSINFSSLSEKIDFISKFIFYLCSYYIRGEITQRTGEHFLFNNTPGEEYSKIRKKFNSKNSFPILVYVLSYSIKNILIKYLHSRVTSKIENFLSLNHNFEKGKDENIPNSFTFKLKTILYRMLIKLSSDLPTFENILEKIEEIQFCYFFINGKFYDFVQRIFSFNYLNINTDINSKDELQISTEGFKFFGYLMGLKLLIEILLKLRNVYKTYKIEKEKLTKEITEIENKLKSNALEGILPAEVQQNLFKLNIKSKKNPNTTHDQKSQLHNTLEEETSCLLCLDQRTNTSSTPCGHLFCWSCLINYLQSNDSCPFCRQKCNANEVIFLQNFK